MEAEPKETEKKFSAAREAFGTAEVFKAIRYRDQLKGQTVKKVSSKASETRWSIIPLGLTKIDGEKLSWKIDTTKPCDKKLCIIETRRARTADSDGFADYGIFKVPLSGMQHDADADDTPILWASYEEWGRSLENGGQLESTDLAESTLRFLQKNGDRINFWGVHTACCGGPLLTENHNGTIQIQIRDGYSFPSDSRCKSNILTKNGLIAPIPCPIQHFDLISMTNRPYKM